MANPFASAFENGDQGGSYGILHVWAPAQVGEIFGELAEEGAEDSLLGVESAQNADIVVGGSHSSSTSHRKGGANPARDLKGGLSGNIDMGPPQPPTACERLSNVVVCGEMILYKRLPNDIIDSYARSIVRRGFWLHWISAVSLVLNAVLFLTLFVFRRSSLTETCWAVGYLVFVPFFEWFMLTKLLHSTLRTNQTSPSWGLLKFNLFILGVFHLYLLLAPLWSGAGGVITMVELLEKKDPVGLVVISILFILLQLAVLVLGLLVMLQALTIAATEAAREALEI
jgi:hypothetical protein